MNKKEAKEKAKKIPFFEEICKENFKGMKTKEEVFRLINSDKKLTI